MTLKRWMRRDAVLMGCLGAAVAGLATTALAGGGGVPPSGCCSIVECGNLTVRDCIGPCRVGYVCVAFGDCGPPAWAMADCRPGGPGGPD